MGKWVKLPYWHARRNSFLSFDVSDASYDFCAKAVVALERKNIFLQFKVHYKKYNNFIDHNFVQITS